MIQQEAIYKGATRPAMKFGVPLVPLVTLLGAGMLIIMWGGTRSQRKRGTAIGPRST